MIGVWTILYKKSLMTSRIQKPPNRRMIESRMNKIERIKSQTMMYKPQKERKKDRVTRTILKTGDELRCSGKVSSSCSICGTRCVIYYKIVPWNHQESSCGTTLPIRIQFQRQTLSKESRI